MPRIEQEPAGEITREVWDAKFEAAKQLMAEREASGSKRMLIEIAAQHPLVHGVDPSKEFIERLLKGVEIYKNLKDRGAEVEIYVPGSRHMHEGIADDISLSAAGTRFLQDQGVPSDIIHGDDLNLRYKGEDGVYNSADECFVAASYFIDGNFRRLYVVEASGQLHRKTLHYIAFGVFPIQYTAPTMDAFHNPVAEASFTIPHVLNVDPSWQGPDSELGNKSRRERNPDLR